MQLARLGRPWLVWSALAEFRHACRIKELRGATPAQNECGPSDYGVQSQTLRIKCGLAIFVFQLWP
jgi:hypothetical protein